jgi:uncharacterized protein (DUF4415 family)
MPTKYLEDGKTIVSYSAQELRQHPSQTDMDRAASMTDEELTANALSDPDAQPLDDDFFKRAKRMRLEDFLRANKEKVCLRLDREVVSWFRARGRGYQTKINAALRAFIDSQEH